MSKTGNSKRLLKKKGRVFTGYNGTTSISYGNAFCFWTYGLARYTVCKSSRITFRVSFPYIKFILLTCGGFLSPIDKMADCKSLNINIALARCFVLDKS